MVQVVAEIMPEAGSRDATAAHPAATSRAAPSQTSTPSALAGPTARGSSTTSSPLERAPVQRLNAGASRAIENRIIAHTE